MKLQAIVSSVALAAALTFSGGAVAQMAFELSVPGEQEQAVRNACAALMAESTASLTATDTEDSTVDETTTGSTGTDDSSQSTSGDPASQDYWDVVIAGLTLENCKAMGL
jgi:hypothetical protein